MTAIAFIYEFYHRLSELHITLNSFVSTEDESIQLLIKPGRLQGFTTARKAGGECDARSSIGQLFTERVGDLE